jgi:CheY-like chemotaxis protein
MSTADGKPGSSALAEVAHELRAPLGGIEAMAELLAAGDLDAEQRRLVAGLTAAARHLRDVAGEIIEQARGHRPADPCIAAGAFSLRTLADSVATAAEARARAKSLAFALDVDHATPDELHGDARRIRQMLENLIDNAFKVTRQGRVALAIRQVDRRGAFTGLMFELTDTGPGITDEDREKLFRAHSQIDNGIPGSGLGLALVHRMARAMGGDAGCWSTPGEGATFWFTLRLRTAEPGADGAMQHGPVLTVSAAVQDAPVLVVDDNQANRMILRAILEHFGHQVVEAATGEEALEAVGSLTLKAVMLDQTLPGISGLDTLGAIRRLQGPAARLPVIPVTGRVAPEDKAAFAAAGADGFVEKPVNARAIRDALDAALGGRNDAAAGIPGLSNRATRNA